MSPADLAAELAEAVRLIEPLSDLWVLEQIIDSPEIVGEIIELHGHALGAQSDGAGGTEKVTLELAPDVETKPTVSLPCLRCERIVSGRLRRQLCPPCSNRYY